MFSQVLPAARNFVYCNARLLDRRLFEMLFDGAPRDGVLSALHAYQNQDGGFGSALEADLRAPSSQPVPVEQAFFILDMIDGFDDPMVLRACDFLASITTADGGVPFAVPGLEEYPRTPWWQSSTQAALNPTASLLGLLLKHGIRHPWVETASTFCRREIETFDGCHYHDVMPVVTFLRYCPQRDWAERHLALLRARLASSGEIALDPAAQGYVQFPLDWSPEPTHPLRSLFSKQIIDQHLQALAARQQTDGGWPISWQAVGVGAEYEWRGHITVRALWTLRENS